MDWSGEWMGFEQLISEADDFVTAASKRSILMPLLGMLTHTMASLLMCSIEM